jgi:hypothetical protein
MALRPNAQRKDVPIRYFISIIGKKQDKSGEKIAFGYDFSPLVNSQSKCNSGV